MAHKLENDYLFMQRALELARLGTGYVSPNPLVGAVVVHQDRIIGEGWHRKFGGPHAEVEAIIDVENQELLRESTIYVNLEPCSHHGKTPPCADLIIEKQLKRVVIANKDINPIVAGNGIRKLQEAGIAVRIGVLEREAAELNVRFFHSHQTHRPRIILKWAETADGFIARKDYSSKWISDAYSRTLVHKWRSEEDAVMVGTNTGYYDNPSLNVRDWNGRNPVRVVIDRHLRLPTTMNLFDGSQTTLVFNLVKSESGGNVNFIKLTAENFWEELMICLHKQGIQSVLVEGGAKLLNYLIQNSLWDEARVFKSPATFRGGIKAPVLSGEQLIHQQSLRKDQLFLYKNVNQHE